MKVVQCFLLFLLIDNCFLEELDRENGVLVLNNENFDEIVKENKPILINFYAPWCSMSQKLQPHFEAVSMKFLEQKSSIKLGKVDATEEIQLAERFKITGYPTLILMKEDRQIYYKKSRDRESLEKWLHSKVDSLIVQINSTNFLDNLKQNSDVLVIVDDALIIEHLEVIAENMDDIQFARMESLLFTSLYSFSEKRSLILFRKIDQALIPFVGELNKENIERFIQMNEFPGVVQYSVETGGRIFTNPHRYFHFLMFVDSNLDKAQNDLLKMSKNHLETIFVSIDTKYNYTKSLLEYFKVDQTKLPHLILSDIKKKRIFLPEFSDINADKIDQFIKDVKEGKIKQFLKSKEIPENWDKEPVKILVGKNFESVAYDKSKHVFVEFYAPWCSHCKQLAPIWDKLGEELANVPDLIIAKLDKTENDINEIEIKSFPVLKLFLKESNEVIDFTGPRTRKNFKEFLSKYVNLNEAKMKTEL